MRSEVLCAFITVDSFGGTIVSSTVTLPKSGWRGEVVVGSWCVSWAGPVSVQVGAMEDLRDGERLMLWRDFEIGQLQLKCVDSADNVLETLWEISLKGVSKPATDLCWQINLGHRYWFYFLDTSILGRTWEAITIRIT